MKAVVIGYGNTLRGDDGVGPKVADEVAAQALPGVQALAVPQLTPELAEVLAQARLAVFVDASTGPADMGIEVLPVRASEHAAALGHTSDPGVLLGLARAVYGRCPPAWMIRIPAVSFQFGAGLSPAINRALAAALREVIRLVTPTDSGCGGFGSQVLEAVSVQRKECQ